MAQYFRSQTGAEHHLLDGGFVPCSAQRYMWRRVVTKSGLPNTLFLDRCGDHEFVVTDLPQQESRQ